MFQSINRDHVKGALVGVGICAVGYYMYKKNQCQVDDFLRKQGINVSNSNAKDYSAMSLEELMETKELIEDVLAEKTMNSELEGEAKEDVVMASPELEA